MLLFVCERGVAAAGARAHRTLEGAASACPPEGRVLVLDASRLEAASDDPERLRLDSPGAVLNVDSAGLYLPPEPISAAGGYVVRRAPAGVELLMIFRRGAWDLPKGKLDPGESPEAGAAREVAEEVGIDPGRLHRLQHLGSTVHGYPHPKRPTFAVKTTEWYSFTTDAAEFVPQAEEDIETVEWVPWTEAGGRLGFDSLREHHERLDPDTLGV